MYNVMFELAINEVYFCFDVAVLILFLLLKVNISSNVL